MFLEKGSLITFDAGHNCYPDSGATGFKQEDTLTKEIVSLLIPKFQSLGYKTKDCTPYGVRFNSVNESLAYRVNQANTSESSLHICDHFNCGGGHGVECWIAGTGGKAEQFANQICNEIATLGYTNRGVKVGNLYVPKNTNMPCVLIEGAFVDSQEDMNRYNAESMANAIVKAVTGQAVNPTPQPIQVPQGPSIRYQAQVENVGWQGWVQDGQVAGTEGKGLRLEALAIDYKGTGNISVEGHVQNVGWQSIRHDGEIIGTVGEALRLEAIKISLDDKDYSVQYQVHVQDIGWMNWVSDGVIAGTTGQGKRLEAIRIKIVKRC